MNGGRGIPETLARSVLLSGLSHGRENRRELDLLTLNAPIYSCRDAWRDPAFTTNAVETPTGKSSFSPSTKHRRPNMLHYGQERRKPSNGATAYLLMMGTHTQKISIIERGDS